VGAALTTPFARAATAGEMVEALVAAGFDLLALSPRGEADLGDIKPGARTAVLFGAEGPGLPAEVLSRCRTARIPMAGDFDSLNVATSSGIVLHHLAVAAGMRPPGAIS